MGRYSNLHTITPPQTSNKSDLEKNSALHFVAYKPSCLFLDLERNYTFSSELKNTTFEDSFQYPDSDGFWIPRGNKRKDEKINI